MAEPWKGVPERKPMTLVKRESTEDGRVQVLTVTGPDVAIYEAAPDLLAALEIVMRFLSFDRTYAHKIGKAAIAKARGQASNAG